MLGHHDCRISLGQAHRALDHAAHWALIFLMSVLVHMHAWLHQSPGLADLRPSICLQCNAAVGLLGFWWVRRKRRADAMASKERLDSERTLDKPTPRQPSEKRTEDSAEDLGLEGRHASKVSISLSPTAYPSFFEFG